MSLVETPMPPYPWQNTIWQSFCENVAAKRVPHALLINGVQGVGVEQLAYAMARFLLCQSPLEDVACGRCRGCQLIASGTHPDLFMLKLEEDAAQIKVDQVRTCVDFVAKTAYANGPKLVLVEQAETMNINAANALLKSLEEPQGETVFLLTTNRLSALLPTIRSRCRAVTVNVPTESQATQWIGEQGLNIDTAWLAQAGGAPLLAKAWLEGDYAETQTQLLNDLTLLLGQREGAIQAAARWQKMNLGTVLDILVNVLEGVIKGRISDDYCSELFNGLLAQLSGVDDVYLFRFRDKLLAKLGQWRGNANLNAAMLVEELAMDWVALSQLVARRA